MIMMQATLARRDLAVEWVPPGIPGNEGLKNNRQRKVLGF
jgi:hypothetical protein